MTLTTKQIAALMDIKPTSRGLRPVRLTHSLKEQAFSWARSVQSASAELHAAYFAIGCAAQMVAWACETGRVTGADVCDFREMTPWRVCKVIGKVAERPEEGTEAERVERVVAAIREMRK